MNSEYNIFLKKLEEIHSKNFKKDESYIEGCKANKDLSPKDYNIYPNHKLDEYFKKYGNKLEKGKLLAYKKDELWLMDKHTKYWKIENDSDFVYFALPYVNKKPLWISLASLLVAGAIAGGVTAGVLLYKGNNGSGEGEEDEPLPPGPTPEIMHHICFQTYNLWDVSTPLENNDYWDIITSATNYNKVDGFYYIDSGEDFTGTFNTDSESTVFMLDQHIPIVVYAGEDPADSSCYSYDFNGIPEVEDGSNQYCGMNFEISYNKLIKESTNIQIVVFISTGG